MFDGSLGYELEWEGRQLKTYRAYEYDIDTVLYFDTITYTYNADGIRTSKTVNGVKHEYLLDGAQIVSETWTRAGADHLLVYLYDETGAPIGLKYRTNAYAEGVYDSFFFDKNLQGDIVAVYNSSGEIIGTYTYDAWGACTYSFSGSQTTLETSIIRNYNPFRYRGYFYDRETNLYYLQSRYYNPSWCRFISPDEYDVVLVTPDQLTDKNLYAYCDNNPITREDDDGEFWGAILKVAVGVAAQYVGDVIGNIVNGETGWDVLKPTSSIGEYVSAGVTALIPGSGITSALTRSVVSEGIQSVEREIKGEENNLEQSIVSIAKNTVLDFGFSKASDWVDSKIHKLEPRNYSSYAGTVRKKNPTATRVQITRKMIIRTTSVRALKKTSSFTFSTLNTIFS